MRGAWPCGEQMLDQQVLSLRKDGENEFIRTHTFYPLGLTLDSFQFKEHSYKRSSTFLSLLAEGISVEYMHKVGLLHHPLFTP